jgi:intracellular septation protein A
MKPLALILAFLPLIAFSFLSRFLSHGDIGVAGLVAAVCAVIVILVNRPVWPPNVLNVIQVVLFGLVAVFGFALGAGDDRWLGTWGGAGIGLVLGLIILLLVPVVPFTEAFARKTTPQAYWSSPTFIKINRMLSAAWGVAIMLIGVSRVAGEAVSEHTTHRLPEIILSLIVPLIVIIYMLRFSKSYPQRVSHEPAHADVTSR